ncbi:MAG: hypothetical protein AAGI70_03475 [Pseudomonadota bacterium]
MHNRTPRDTLAAQACAFLGLVHALTVRDLRVENRSAALGVLIPVGVILVWAAAFYFFLSFIGSRVVPIRADRLTFLVGGVLVFFFHVQTATAVANALNPAMMRHAPATPFLFVCVKALGAGYKLTLAALILLAANGLVRGIWEMVDPLTLIAALGIAWGGGVAVGVLFMAAKRYLTWAQIVQTAYMRLCFFTSGKFFVASHLPGQIRDVMEWNPLFHVLDQARGAMFLNYTAATTGLLYPVQVYGGLAVLALLVEHWVRTRYSLSHAPLG